MRIERYDDERSMRAEIKPFDDSDVGGVTVERSRDWHDFGQWRGPAGVNWSCFGPVEPERARQFAEALLAGCRLADEMTAVSDDEFTTPGGYMVLYTRGKDRIAKRVEDGEEVPMYDGWAVGKLARETSA